MMDTENMSKLFFHSHFQMDAGWILMLCGCGSGSGCCFYLLFMYVEFSRLLPKPWPIFIDYHHTACASWQSDVVVCCRQFQHPDDVEPTQISVRSSPRHRRSTRLDSTLWIACWLENSPDKWNTSLELVAVCTVYVDGTVLCTNSTNIVAMEMWKWINGSCTIVYSNEQRQQNQMSKLCGIGYPIQCYSV